MVLMDSKYKTFSCEDSKFKALKPGSSIHAQIEMCRMLNARFILVFETNGRQPHTYYEYDINTEKWNELGILDTRRMNEEEEKIEVRRFWKENLGLDY